MAVVLPGIARTRPFRTTSGEFLAPVILDIGEEARVSTVLFPHWPRIGDRFDFDGHTWEVTQGKDFQRGLVARPVKPGACVH
jgi:hypothetical protein